MKKTFTFYAVLALAAAFLFCGAAFAVALDAGKPANVTELAAGKVSVWEKDGVKLHAYETGDPLGDECFVVEGKDSLVGIELPAFTAGLEAWKDYVESLGKPLEAIFVNAHPTGGSYFKGVKVIGTEGAKAAIEGGSTAATAGGLYAAFGNDFHAAPEETAQITSVVPAGKAEVGGIEFAVIPRGDTYDLAIPALNCVYTHMLGGKSHSIMANADHMKFMASVMEEYKAAGYDMVLSAHCAPEGQDAVAEKAAYIKKSEEIAAACASADEFISKMKEAFPDYAGVNYLEMSAGFIYQK